jgi:DNA-binding NarL/FixJ family response regulator
MDAGAEAIRILIVDDHPIMRVGIAAIINAQPRMQVVGQAGTAGEAVRMFESLLPDLTLMDLRLPDRSGVEAIRAICAISPKVPAATSSRACSMMRW